MAMSTEILNHTAGITQSHETDLRVPDIHIKQIMSALRGRTTVIGVELVHKA